MHTNIHKHVRTHTRTRVHTYTHTDPKQVRTLSRIIVSKIVWTHCQVFSQQWMWTFFLIDLLSASSYSSLQLVLVSTFSFFFSSSLFVFSLTPVFMTAGRCWRPGFMLHIMAWMFTLQYSELWVHSRVCITHASNASTTSAQTPLPLF